MCDAFVRLVVVVVVVVVVVMVGSSARFAIVWKVV
jgi:hypothetical protein